MLSHAVVGFALGLLAAGLLSDLLGGAYAFVYYSVGGILLLIGLILVIRDLVSPRERPA